MSGRNEADTRGDLIEPALRESGWGVDESRIRREELAPGRILPNGERETGEWADYVLSYKTHKLAVLEAKKESLEPTEGVNQAKRYAERLQTRFAYSTNGHKIYEIDMKTGSHRFIDSYPSPDKLWEMTYSEVSQWRDRFAQVPFEDRGGTWEARYYQHNAINKVLEAIANEQKRILLTMATGTGKTFIAFQLAWKLFHSRWNLNLDGKRQPNILFLADRNILADQAYNAFSAFPEDALVRIAPDSIRKKGDVPTNGGVFFTIFQTFMTGVDKDGNPSPNFGKYEEDFFDFIIIDECHRGGANDESTWRGILDYFSPAVQLGLTATPRRVENVDTYEYFDKPVYEYSLTQGIEDGYLTPFRVKDIRSNIDKYEWQPGDDILAGEVEVGREYTPKEINRIIEIKEREEYRVNLMLKEINQSQKTIVFCATQNHALRIRDLINENTIDDDPHYCVRVTADDGKIGEQYLREFQDNEKTIPTILTTSRKLSTGVDALNIRNIVIMRPIKTMVEFKQIIGRGTRTFDNKGYFTIYDFEKAYEHFKDPDWDGLPDDCEKCGENPCECSTPELCEKCNERPCECEKPLPTPCDECDGIPCVCEKKEKIIIKLADGTKRNIEHTIDTLFYSPEGAPMSASEFIQHLFGEIPEFFHNEDELRKIWKDPRTRKSLLEGLAEKGFGRIQLEEIRRLINAEMSDLFDVLSYIAYEITPIRREDRANHSKNVIFTQYTPSQQMFLDFVLAEYVKEGVGELDQEKLPDLLELKYGGVREGVQQLGDQKEIREIFTDFQQYLYMEQATG